MLNVRINVKLSDDRSLEANLKRVMEAASAAQNGIKSCNTHLIFDVDGSRRFEVKMEESR